LYLFKEDIDWWMIPNAESLYMKKTGEFEFSSLENVKFLSTVESELILTFGGQKVGLVFASDPGRELFRVMLKKVLDLKQFKREFSRPDASGGDDNEAKEEPNKTQPKPENDE
jgi:hypothetical protein